MKKWQGNKKSGAGEKGRQDRAGEKRCREISEPKKAEEVTMRSLTEKTEKR